MGRRRLFPRQRPHRILPREWNAKSTRRPICHTGVGALSVSKVAVTTHLIAVFTVTLMIRLQELHLDYAFLRRAESDALAKMLILKALPSRGWCRAKGGRLRDGRPGVLRQLGEGPCCAVRAQVQRGDRSGGGSASEALKGKMLT